MWEEVKSLAKTLDISVKSVFEAILDYLIERLDITEEDLEEMRKTPGCTFAIQVCKIIKVESIVKILCVRGPTDSIDCWRLISSL